MSNEPTRGRARTTILAAIVLLVTFAAGFVSGIAGHRAFLFRHRADRGTRHMTQFVVNRLDAKLDLTDAQRAQIAQILDRRHQRMAAARNDMHKRMRAEIDQANAEIAAVLTPAQREEFNKLKMHFPPRGRRPR